MATASRPPFTDSNGVVYDTNGADFEGFLTKRSQWLHDWRRRYFILKGSKLFFAKSAAAQPHGIIDLATCMTVKSAELKAKRRHALEVSTPDEIYLMFADSEKEKDDWIGAIGRAIVKCSSTYQSEDGEESGSDDGSDYDEDGY